MKMRFMALVVLVALAGCSTGNNVSPLAPALSPSAVSLHLPREHVIYDFPGGSEGASPQGTFIADPSGGLYGTTTYGGIAGCTFGAGCGTVFKLTPNGRTYTLSVLYAFQGGGDGEGPASGVVADASGTLYGTTEYGGSAGDGIVFKVVPASYKETVLYSFKGGKDGNAPLGGLTIDASGNLYGATLLGGNGSQCQTGSGCGIIFELQRAGSTYTERVLYRFSGGSDGATPGSPPIFVGRNLYGTAATGGGSPSCGGAPINPGCGTVYELVTRGSGFKFKVIYRFTGKPHDAANAFAGLTLGKNRALYGIGQYGGANNEGAAFAMVRSRRHYTERLLHSFGGSGDGSYPLEALAFNGSNDVLYGTTEYGGTANDGTVFSLKTSRVESVLLSFQNGAGGAYPLGGILIGANGALYGTASYGGTGSSPAGLAFRL